MEIKKGDFVEIEYIGKLKDTGLVFDTNIEEVAKKEKLQENATYKPITIIVGENNVLKGIDKAIEGKELGDYTINIHPDDGFGRKSAELLRLVPMKIFHAQQIQPYPGLNINIDGNLGIVRSVSGGRVIVDFNHPLASMDLIYELKLKRIVEDNIEKIKAVLDLNGIPYTDVKTENEKTKITLKDKLPEEIAKKLAEEIERLTKVKDAIVE